NPDLLSAAVAASQAHEVDQHARTAEPGIEAAHPRRAHLPEGRELPAAGAGLGGRDARELAGGDPLPQHGPSEGAQERGPAGLGRLTAAGRGRHCATRGSAPPTPNITSRLLQNLTHTTLSSASKQK